MLPALISLLIVIIVVGIVAWLVVWLIDMTPIDGRFKQIARVLVMVIAILIILMKALPILGVHV